MGFLDFVVDTVFSTVDAVCRVADVVREAGERAMDWVKDRIEDFKDAFSRRSSYSGTSVTETIDVDKELSNFKESLFPKLSDCEHEYIQLATVLFQEVINGLKSDFPVLTRRAEARKEEAIKRLKGTTNNFMSQCVSENNFQLLEILKMHPGEAKKEKIGNYLQKAVDDAYNAFHKKLQSEVDALNEELNASFQDVLNTKETSITNEMEKLKQLEREQQQNTFCVEQHIANAEPILEASDYMVELLMNDLGGAQ